MYTHVNYRTKKALKEAIAQGTTVTVFQPNDFYGAKEAKPSYSGRAFLEGPHFPEPHRWYAQAEIEHGRVVRVK